MSNRYIRLYTKPDKRKPATWLGFSRSAADVDPTSNAELEGFFSAHQYTVREVDFNKRKDRKALKVLGGVSCRYYEIRPPIADEHIPDLGEILKKYVTTHHNEGHLIDNRKTPSPFTPIDLRGKTIAVW